MTNLPRLPAPRLLGALLVLPWLTVSACSSGPAKDGVPETTTPATSAPTTSVTPDPATSSPPTSRPTRSARKPLAGIDLSHHQGPVDWARVATSGIRFAYLKATEGTGFTDPAFAAHRAAARRQGIRVGGYHYFQLCSDGVAQARHFVDVLGKRADGDLPPAVDLELAGSCATPPTRDQLLAEVRAFLTTLEQEYDVRPVVYVYPDLEARFSLVADLASYPQWVRRLGERPPRRPWRIWQHDDQGSVPGIAGGVDLDLMKR